MPWCETCSKFWNPSSVSTEGTCPTCGKPLTSSEPRYDAKNLDVKELAGETKAPWHFKLLVVALVLYLGWRLVQLVQWAFF